MDESPVALPKALKNPTEVRGMKNANVSYNADTSLISILGIVSKETGAASVGN